MLELLSLPFMQRALLAGVLVGLLASYFGAIVVQRGLTFYGNGLAHAAFGGAALGLLVGMEPLVVAMPFTVAVGVGIVWVRERTRLSGDTTIGIFFAVSMALGIIFLSLRREFSADAFSLLFGSILAVQWVDLWVTLGVVGMTLLTLPLWGRWAYATFDRELAQSDRIQVLRDDYILAFCLAVTVVTAVKVIGIVLIAAFLVIPAAAARLIARTFFSMTIVSMIIGSASAVVGLGISYYVDIPSGPAIILLQAAVFCALIPFQAGRR